MSATFFCYLRFHNILGFYIHDSIPELASVKCKRYIGVICKNLWVTSLFYILRKMAKNTYISRCGDLLGLASSPYESSTVSQSVRDKSSHTSQH